MDPRLRPSCWALLVVACVTSARAARAQECTGSVAYIVRDPRGRVMVPEQVRRLTIKSVDGVPLRRRASAAPGGPPEYVDDKLDVVTRDAVAVPLAALRNPLAFRTPCGRLGDVTLRYAGMEMTLVFDLAKRNGWVEVDSRPFQQGTFNLRGVGWALPCAARAGPPVSGDTTGPTSARVCRVAADGWEDMNEHWVRHLVPLTSAMGEAVPAEAGRCRTGAVESITTRAEWRDAWSTHRSVARTNPLPDVDFRTQFVLGVYLPDQRPTYTLASVTVNKRGDLTFVPARRHPADERSESCGLVYLVLSRSGVRSVGGRPLPPPTAG